MLLKENILTKPTFDKENNHQSPWTTRYIISMSKNMATAIRHKSNVMNQLNILPYFKERL